MLVSSLTDEDLTNTANTVKDGLLDALGKEGLLTKPAEEIARSYAVVLHRPGFFGRVLDKLFNMKNNDLRVTVVKIVA